VQIDREQSEADGEMRSVRDVCLDVTNLVETLASVSEGEHLETVHITGSSRLGVSCDGLDIETADEIASVLDARGVPVDEFDVYERFDEQHAAE
jgi:CRISPR-associated protein Csh2